MGRDVVSAKLDVIFKKLFTENEPAPLVCCKYVGYPD